MEASQSLFKGAKREMKICIGERFGGYFVHFQKRCLALNLI